MDSGLHARRIPMCAVPEPAPRAAALHSALRSASLQCSPATSMVHPSESRPQTGTTLSRESLHGIRQRMRMAQRSRHTTLRRHRTLRTVAAQLATMRPSRPIAAVHRSSLVLSQVSQRRRRCLALRLDRNQ